MQFTALTFDRGYPIIFTVSVSACQGNALQTFDSSAVVCVNFTWNWSL